MWVKVTEGYDAVLGTLGFSVFVGFDFRNCHGREGFAEDVGHVFIFVFRDIVPCVGGIVESKVLFHIGSIPYVFVGR